MRILLMTTAAVAVLAVGLPASAQILGGQVGTNVGAGVGLPQTGPLTGQVGQTVRGAAGMTRDTTREVRGTLNSRPDAGLETSTRTDGSASASDSGATGGLNLSTGATVHGSDGGLLGSVVRLTRDSAGRAETLVVKSADGTLRAVPASGLSLHGDAVVTTSTSAEFNRTPPLQ